MKLKNISALLVLVIFFGALVSCSKSGYTAEQLVCYYKKSCDFLEKTRSNSKIMEESESIAKSCGFKEALDVAEAYMAHEKDPEVQKWSKKYTELTDQILREETKALEKQMDDAAGSTDSTVISKP